MKTDRPCEYYSGCGKPATKRFKVFPQGDCCPLCDEHFEMQQKSYAFMQEQALPNSSGPTQL